MLHSNRILGRGPGLRDALRARKGLRSAVWMGALIGGLLCAGCGQKGKLVLPPSPATATNPTTTTTP